MLRKTTSRSFRIVIDVEYDDKTFGSLESGEICEALEKAIGIAIYTPHEMLHLNGHRFSDCDYDVEQPRPPVRAPKKIAP